MDREDREGKLIDALQDITNVLWRLIWIEQGRVEKETNLREAKELLSIAESKLLDLDPDYEG